MGTNVFLEEALSVVPRALGLCDRDAVAATFGCCDRSYWHYRLTDFPNARFQEAGLLMALAATANVDGNPYFGQQDLSDWARATWRHWLAKRNRDGSVAEAYPGERSYCATAFGAAALMETVGLLGGPTAWKEELEQAHATMKWLVANEARETGNQAAASLWALAGYARLSDSEDARTWAERRRENILVMADPRGVLAEYGGLDAGYQSISMAAISRTIRWLGKDDKLEALLRVGEAILDEHMGSNGDTDPRKNSRNTQYIYPSSLANLKSPLVARLIKGLTENSLLRPSWMDDRYCIAFAIDYFFAGLEATDVDVAS
jgi:hypothetical protein